jgi:hypothetical protein
MLLQPSKQKLRMLSNQWTEILTNLRMRMMNPNQPFTAEESTNATKETLNALFF